MDNTTIILPDNTLKSRILKTDLINWHDLKFLQSDSFKDLEPESKSKLKASLFENNFSQPFYVWQSPEGDIYCLDGKHRSLILSDLIAEGVNVPDLLPATFIHCENKKQASKLVLIYSSIYARVSQQGLFDFIQEYDLSFEDFKNEIDLPDFSFDRFEQKFDVFDIKSQEEEPVIDFPTTEKVIVKSGDIFQLGDHRIVCGDFKNEDLRAALMMGEKAVMLITDPPYNLSANDIGNLGLTQHHDFVEAYGEMTDEEFVDFLSGLMKLAKQYTIDGAIHYIFMDWRHCWHMTEASMIVYGSRIPKQLCVWNKDTMALGSFYRSKHELCFVFKSGEGKHISHIDLIDRIRTNVWNYPSGISTANEDRALIKDHPTPKPTSMISDAILDTSNDGDYVLDFFLGSGTTLIACEKTNRKCLAMEIEPKFVQLSINRYINYCVEKNRTIIFRHLNGNLTLKDFENGQSKRKN